MQRPVFEISEGMLKAKIYRRKISGRLKYTVSLTRVFRNGDVWNESTRFGSEDLLPASWLLTEAYRWIHAKEVATKK